MILAASEQYERKRILAVDSMEETGLGGIAINNGKITASMIMARSYRATSTIGRVSRQQNLGWIEAGRHLWFAEFGMEPPAVLGKAKRRLQITLDRQKALDSVEDMVISAEFLNGMGKKQ